MVHFKSNHLNFVFLTKHYKRYIYIPTSVALFEQIKFMSKKNLYQNLFMLHCKRNHLNIFTFLVIFFLSNYWKHSNHVNCIVFTKILYRKLLTFVKPQQESWKFCYISSDCLFKLTSTTWITLFKQIKFMSNMLHFKRNHLNLVFLTNQYKHHSSLNFIFLPRNLYQILLILHFKGNHLNTVLLHFCIFQQQQKHVS
jgi:hypothetical protein